jgi:hypothetical protein
MQEMPAGIPTPLMYGPSFPKIKVVMRDGVQHFESRTNQNLNLTPEDFDQRGTYTMARFLTTRGPCDWCADEAIVSDMHHCPLVFQEVQPDENGWPEKWIMWSRPDYANCPSVQAVTSLCNTDAQRQFFDRFCEALSPDDLPTAYPQAVTPIENANRGTRQMCDLQRRVERMLLETELSYPALIPEVWFNVIGHDKTAEDEAHLEENPQRVDFVMFAEGVKCVIEIDGPSHYAVYDEGSRRYEVSEQRYTKNLRIERSLRRQGWQIFRFSNYEVETTSVDDFEIGRAHV